jgi:hypothetical protein
MNQIALFSVPDIDEEQRRQKSKFSAPDVDKMRQRTPRQEGGGPRQEGGGKQTVYGIFAQACWLFHSARIGKNGRRMGHLATLEFNIQCSDWWEDLAEKDKEKFETLANRSKGPNADEKPAGAGKKSKDGILVSFLPTTTVRSLSPSHKIYRIGAGCSAAEHQTSTTLLLLPPCFPCRVLFCWQQHEATLDAGKKSGHFSTLNADRRVKRVQGRFPRRVLFRRQQHEATLDTGKNSGHFSTLKAYGRVKRVQGRARQQYRGRLLQ